MHILAQFLDAMLKSFYTAVHGSLGSKSYFTIDQGCVMARHAFFYVSLIAHMLELVVNRIVLPAPEEGI